jgi:hypothetical protein
VNVRKSALRAFEIFKDKVDGEIIKKIADKLYNTPTFSDQ